MTNKIINFENKSFTEKEFITLFDSIYEHSSWVIINIIKNKSSIPEKLEDLKLKMKEQVEKSSDESILKLLRAHPELGIKKNKLSSLTKSSQKEQKSAGLDQCSEEEYKNIKLLNKKYREKFDFPFVIAVKGLSRVDVINAMNTRINNNYQEEFLTALKEVHKIAKIRFDTLII